MKIKDYIGWLQTNKWVNGECTWHYYPNKRKSACGRSNHPKIRYAAVYIIGAVCLICEKHCKRNSLPLP